MDKQRPKNTKYNIDILSIQSITWDTKYNVDILTKHPTSRPIYTKYPKYYLGY